MIKKTFFDMWDNMFKIVLVNLGFIAAAAVPLFLPSLFGNATAAILITRFLGLLIVYLYLGTASMITRDVADYQNPGFRDFLKYFRETWKTSLVFGIIGTLHIIVFTVATTVYGSMGTFLGFTALVFVFWGSVIWALASQYFLPIRDRLDSKVRKIVRKCMIMFLDNTLFTIVLAIGAVFTLGISFLTAFLLPGIGSILLLWNVAMKLRLYKYDYLEQNPGANRKKIPWDALLVDDRERVGKRTLKGLIFPWKE